MLGPQNLKATIQLGGPTSERAAALARAGEAVAAELKRSYPEADGYVHTQADESATAQQLGQVFRQVRKARRGRVGIHVGLVATTHNSVDVVTLQDSALSSVVTYALMALGTLSGAVFLVLQRPDIPVRGLIIWAFIGLCVGGGVALGLDRLLLPTIAKDAFSKLHEDMQHTVERALLG